MWRDDLRLLGDLVRLAWRRLRCPRDHGDVLALDDSLWVYCWKCGFQSRGLQIDTAAVHAAWRFDRMRQRFWIRQRFRIGQAS